jgi:hypothetical protein
LIPDDVVLKHTFGECGFERCNKHLRHFVQIKAQVSDRRKSFPPEIAAAWRPMLHACPPRAAIAALQHRE